MATAIPKISLSSSRDIPFNRLVLSQSNVRRVKSGLSKTMTGNTNTATDFRNTILNGDSMQLMRALPRNAVDFGASFH